jgi:hypothetical protein
MILGAAVLLAAALATPTPVPAKASPPPVACTKYRVLAERNDLVGEEEVAGWVRTALERADLLDAASPCFVHLRITAGPIRTGGKEDGFVAHVSASTRRFLRDGKLVTREKGMLLVEPRRETLVPRVRTFVEEFVAGLRSAPTGEGEGKGSDRG